MNKKGFTLVELLGTLVIIALITALILPKIIGWLSNSTDKYLELNEELILDGARVYVEEHPDRCLKTIGSECIIGMEEMINKGYLDEHNVRNIARQSYQYYNVKVIYNGSYFEYYLEK